MAKMVKNSPLPMQETCVQSLHREDPTKKGKAAHSCLENSMDRGTWQARVHGVTKSQTRLSD